MGSSPFASLHTWHALKVRRIRRVHRRRSGSSTRVLGLGETTARLVAATGTATGCSKEPGCLGHRQLFSWSTYEKFWWLYATCRLVSGFQNLCATYSHRKLFTQVAGRSINRYKCDKDKRQIHGSSWSSLRKSIATSWVMFDWWYNHVRWWAKSLVPTTASNAGCNHEQPPGCCWCFSRAMSSLLYKMT